MDQIKFRILSPMAQVIHLDGQGNLLESDHRLFDASEMTGTPVFDLFSFPESLRSEITALQEGEVIWRRGVAVRLPGVEGVFDFAFTRGSGRLYWVVVDLGHAWKGSPQERWQPSPGTVADRDAGAPLKILIAEDNPFNLKVTQRQLSRMGMESDGVGNGQAALDALAERPYDLVLMDLNMPVLDGYEACRQIRSFLPPPLSQIPVVALSSSGLTSHDPGFDAVLKKPAPSELLNQTILALVGGGAHSQGASGEESLIRLDYLQEVTQSNREMIVELMDIYLKEVPEALAQMKVCTENKEWRALRELAHKTKANFRYVGADRMFGLTDTIERYAASGSMVDQIPELMGRLLQLAGPTAAALLEERGRL